MQLQVRSLHKLIGSASCFFTRKMLILSAEMAITLEEILIDDAIKAAKFACDLSQCKGACCTMPGQCGAPLLDNEIEEIKKEYPIVSKHLSFRHRDTIEERGMFQGIKGDYTTQVVDRQACVFVTFEDGIAKCAFERAYLHNEISWRKPISCQLFPIRIDYGMPFKLQYEQISECRGALERGRREDIRLVEFLKPSLIRAFGEVWYTEFLQYCRQEQDSATVQPTLPS